jgi:hypothetical protein
MVGRTPERDEPMVYRSVAAGESPSQIAPSRGLAAEMSDSSGSAPWETSPVRERTEPFGGLDAAPGEFTPAPTGTFADSRGGFDGTSPTDSSARGSGTGVPLRSGGSGSGSGSGLVHRSAAPGAAARTTNAIQRHPDGSTLSRAEMPLVSRTAAPDTGTVQRSSGGIGERLEMPLVAPAIARTASEDTEDGPPPGVVAFGRVSRAVEIDELRVNSNAEPPGTNGGAPEPNLEVLTERVWERIRRKLRIERERSRGVL